MQPLSKILSSNVNVNKLKTNNVNVNDKTYFRRHADKSLNNVRIIASQLEEELDDPNSSYREFYLKCAWQLPEAVIYNNLEAAKKGRDPKKLFVWLSKKSLEA